MPSCFCAYGLTIRCNRALPGVHPICDISAPDLTICLQEMPAELSSLPDDAGEIWWTSPWLDADGRPLRVIRKLNGGEYYSTLYSDGSRFAVDHACRRMWVTWPGHLSEHDIAIYLLGPVMGTVLRLRGTVCLHASAVRIDGSAVAFLGDAGAGKSTIAAGFAHAGYAVLADDVVTLEPRNGCYLVHPGYPHLRLCNETVEKLYGDADALPLFVGTWDKRRLDLIAQGSFQAEPLPLATLYVLGDRSARAADPSVERVSAREAMMVLVANTYGNLQLDSDMRTQEFQFLGRLLQKIPVRKVSAPDDLRFLPALCDGIVRDFRSAIPSAVSGITPPPRAVR